MIKKILSVSKEFINTVTSSMILIFQYIPCASIWFGIMSVPLITYFGYFLSNPDIAIMDFEFFLSYGFPWSILTILGGILFIYSFIYQLTHCKNLIKQGPYRYIRHPQYFGAIIMTLGLTMISLNTSPIFPFANEFSYDYSFLIFIWLIEVIVYIILAKIEDFSLKNKYGIDFLNYQRSVGFMIPFLSFQKRYSH